MQYKVSMCVGNVRYYNIIFAVLENNNNNNNDKYDEIRL